MLDLAPGVGVSRVLMQANLRLFENLDSTSNLIPLNAARWMELDPGAGRIFLLDTASLSALGYENNLSQPAIRLWNDSHHAGE